MKVAQEAVHGFGIEFVGATAFALPARHVHPRSAGILGRALPLPGNAERIRLGRVERQDFLDGDLVLPIVPEVVHVFEVFLRPETKPARRI